MKTGGLLKKHGKVSQLCRERGAYSTLLTLCKSCHTPLLAKTGRALFSTANRNVLNQDLSEYRLGSDNLTGVFVAGNIIREIVDRCCLFRNHRIDHVTDA